MNLRIGRYDGGHLDDLTLLGDEEFLCKSDKFFSLLDLCLDQFSLDRLRYFFDSVEEGSIIH